MSEIPASLAARMQRALDAVATAPAAGFPRTRDSVEQAGGEALAAAATACLQDALRGCDQRDAALPLLAADALVTAACEKADEDELRRLAEQFAPARLARLIAP